MAGAGLKGIVVSGLFCQQFAAQLHAGCGCLQLSNKGKKCSRLRECELRSVHNKTVCLPSCM